MAEEKILEGPETHIAQVGVVVEKLDETVEFLTSLGLGPFVVRSAIHTSATVHGKKVSYENKLALAQQGPVQLELIEYQKGETIHKEFLDDKGEGMHHILFKVRDLEATLDKFAKKGITPLQQDYFVGGGGIAYLDTGKPGGIIIEVIQFPTNYDPKLGLKWRTRAESE